MQIQHEKVNKTQKLDTFLFSMLLKLMTYSSIPTCTCGYWIPLQIFPHFTGQKYTNNSTNITHEVDYRKFKD